MGGTTPACNVDAFPSAPFGWFYPRPVSLLTRRNAPPLALLNAGRCERLWHELALLLFAKESCLRITLHSLGYLCCQGRWALFLYCGRLGVLLGCYLTRLFGQDQAFFQLGLANGHFPIADVRRDLAIPSSVLLALTISSTCLDTNEEIDLRATGSSGY